MTDTIMKQIDSEEPPLPATGDGKKFIDDSEVQELSPPCCYHLKFEGVEMAKGYNLLGIGRGGVVMSNIFLASSLIYLASEEAGCIDEDGDIVEDCEGKAYGFEPISLISNIAVISGLLTAFCMPVIGAIVDYTPHRTMLGIVSSGLIGIIQTIQIGTVSSTWFIMAILQTIAAFLYQGHVLALYAFLPNILQEVGEKTMTKFTATWTATQFGGQAVFLFLVIVVSGFIFSADDVATAQISQVINVVWLTCLFTLGWRKFPAVPRNHELPQGQSLWTVGFKQNFKTVKSLAQDNRKPIRLYFLALCFAEAATNAFTTVSPVYLVGVLELSAQEVGLFFLITLISSVPGTSLGNWVSCKTNPNTSYGLCMLCLAIVANIGAFGLDGVKTKALSYLWGACIGILLGWFYPTENLYFSVIVPKSQEAELSGFYVYCTQILGWLPPLFFSIIVENDYNQKWGILAITSFHMVAVGILCLQKSWEDVAKVCMSEEEELTNKENLANEDDRNSEEEGS